MFSTFVGLGRFINCQRPDISISNERCTSTFSRQWGKLFFMNALIKFVMFLIAAGVLPVLSGLLPVSLLPADKRRFPGSLTPQSPPEPSGLYFFKQI